MTFYNSDNLSNLFSYWQAMGALDFGRSFQISSSWPNRVWPTTGELQISDAASILADELRPLMLPIAQPTRDFYWRETVPVRVALHQIAMDHSWPINFGNNQTKHDCHRHLRTVQTEAQLRHWIELCSEAFGYEIASEPLRNLLRDDRATLYLLRDQGTAKATAATFQTDDILGIHQVGVPTCFRQQGLARTLMLKLMQHGDDLGSRKLTLQASAMGHPLYKALGFDEQFHIHSICAQR